MLDLNATPKRAAKFFPWHSYDDEDGTIFVFDEGYAGFGFTCLPLNGWDASQEQRFQSLLTHELPAGTFIQFSLCVLDDVQDHLDRLVRARGKSRDPLIRQATEMTAHFLAVGAQGMSQLDIPVRNATQIISVKIPIKGQFYDNEEELGMLRRLRREMEEMLETIGFWQLKPMTAVDLVRHLAMILNRGPHASWRAGYPDLDEYLELRDQVLDYDSALKINTQSVQVGETHITSLSVKKYPKRTVFGALARSYSVERRSGARGIACAHMITGTIHVQDITSMRAQMEARLTKSRYFSDGPMGRIKPEHKKRTQDLQAVTDSISAGQFVYSFSLNVMLFSPDAQAASRNTAKAKTYLAELGLALQPDLYINFPLLRMNLPFGPVKTDIKKLVRFKTMPTGVIVTLLPSFFEWRGTPTPLISLIGRGGQIMGFSPWDTDSNYNLTISAQSGSGKSYLANELVSAVLSTGGSVYAIDVGRSYAKLNETLGGQFLQFDPHSAICLNPFSSISSVEEFNEVADILAHLIATMAAPQQGLDDFQTSQLNRILSETFAEYGNQLTIDIIAQAFLDEATQQQDNGFNEKRLSDVGLSLAAFRSDGRYGKFFNGPANIDFDSSFVLLELEELKSQRQLQTIVLLLLIYNIQNRMYLGDRSVKKLLLIDEAWDLLSNDQVAGFIEAGYRRFRKYNGAACIITQSLLDLHGSKTGQAIMSNSACTIMLRQQESALNRLSTGEDAIFTPEIASVLKTVHTVPGRYSEVFIRSPFGEGIGRFVVPPFTSLLYSTRPEDTAAIDRHVRAGKDMKAAIEAVLEERASGKVRA